MQTLSVARRFCGPDGTANGGYFCGRVAAFAKPPVTVRLVRPVPLETTLAVEHDGGLPSVRFGESVLAETRPGTVGDLAPPVEPSYADAVAAARAYAGLSKPHPAASCFVCGPRRTPGDGLCIFAGPLAPGVVAAPWTPDASLDDGRGAVREEIVWAALDCPGFAAAAPDMREMLLGEFTAQIRRRPRIGEACVALGWTIGASGRKHECGTALFGVGGECCALARAIWIEPRSAAAKTGAGSGV